MSDMIKPNQAQAEQLHQEAMQLDEEGHEDEALEKYREALALDPQRATTHYNIGLIYKYRNDWENSFAFNRTAYSLAPDDEAARWNLAIAATALKDWETVRSAWADGGIKLDGNTGPITMDFGPTPVRLNPDEGAEVVWARRIDPVRARIESIPLPESGFCHGDIVLHDGAATGYRMNGERECPVFNVLELFEMSPLSTFKLMVNVPQQSDLNAFSKFLGDQDFTNEDWTANLHTLCAACSEGRPHEHHEHAPEAEKPWNAERELGVAAASQQALEMALSGWTGGGVTIHGISCELAAHESDADAGT